MGMSFRFLIIVTILLCFAHATFPAEFPIPFPIVEDHGTALYLSEQAREAFENITLPIAVVAVIGPYCSGKSYFLNQLLDLSCKDGFDVGRLHDMRTKGIWGTWTAEMKIDGAKTFVLFLDTEAYERVGNSDFYDDRIFALATVMSSVLIYNLPETIHLTDMDRLSFAVELAQKFYGRVKGLDVPYEPAKLLWLIQREFLDGRSVQEVVHDALLSVPNHNGNKNIDMINQIHDTLAVMTNNVSAFSLPQPHLERSRLCDMTDDELDPIYVKKRDQVIPLVASIIRPKILQGQPIHGKEFVSFLDQILDVASKIEIPYTGSLVDVFNNAVLQRCLELYAERMGALHLPISEPEVRGHHEASMNEARQYLGHQHLGGDHLATKLTLQLEEATNKLYRNLIMENMYRSSKFCEGSYARCAEKIYQIQLPSIKKMKECFQQCNQNFARECFGPARNYYEQRMMKLLQRSHTLSMGEYHQRLRFIFVAIFLLMVAAGAVYLRENQSRDALLPLHRVPHHRD